MKNGFGLVRQLQDQFLLGADGAQVQVLDVREEAAFHLVERQKAKIGKLRSGSRDELGPLQQQLTHSGQLLCAPDDLHEGPVHKVPDLTEAGAELDVGLADLQLHQQQLGLDELDLVKLTAKVVAMLRCERASEVRTGQQG